MKLNNVKIVIKMQAKSYAVIALNTFGVALNDLDVKSLYEEIECVMKLYSSREAVEKAKRILAKGGKAIWKKK